MRYRASLPRRRVGGGGCSASTDASALGPAAPGTQSAAYSAAMGLRAVPDGGYAASTPIWLLAVERGHHCLAERSAGGAAIGGLNPAVTRKWLPGRLAGCCLLIDRLHGLNSLFLIIRSACMHD